MQVVTLTPLPPDGVQALAHSGFGPFSVHAGEHAHDMLARLRKGRLHAVIVAAEPADAALQLLQQAAPDCAVLVVAGTLDPETVLDWLQRGAQDVLLREELAAPSLPLRLRAAFERKRLERNARTAYATDVGTGLPHQQQLIEHMSQLIALREREPAPMALLALRIEGLASAEARYGRDTSNVLRRKVGVRLRAGVRASDVVASLGDDHFAVLLGSMLAPADAGRVAAKLLKALQLPFRVAGTDLAVATAVGIGQYPQDGAQPDALLRRAVGLAATTQAQGRAGFANFGEGGAAGAANDG